VSTPPPDAAAFATFGYAVVRGMLTAAECRSVAAELTEAFRQAYPDLASRRLPAWLPGLADATPCSARLTADDERLWRLSQQLLGCETLPCPPEVAWLSGITPWHYDDPLGLRGVKFLVYVSGPATGVRLLPMSHTSPQRERVREFLTANVGKGLRAQTSTEAVEREVVPAVPVTVEPGDIVAIDLHVWHCYGVRHPRVLWAPEFLAWPVEPAQALGLEEKFAAVAAAGATDGGGPEWPVWREWLRATDASEARRRAVEMLRSAGAFRHGRDLR